MLHSVLVLIIALATIPWSKIAEFHPKTMFPFFFLKEESTIGFINEDNFGVTNDKTTFFTFGILMELNHISWLNVSKRQHNIWMIS